jgi:hypothetical protein
VSFMRFELGFFDHETCHIESEENPFAAKVSHLSGIGVGTCGSGGPLVVLFAADFAPQNAVAGARFRFGTTFERLSLAA